MAKTRAGQRLERLLAAAGLVAREWGLFETGAPLREAPPPRITVLVVDDEPVNLMLVEAMLSRWGIDVMLAGDGAEAVALACEQPMDLILMDLQMPVLDGVAATRQIRRFEREQALARVPVVAYTTSTVHRSALRDIGIDDILSKPCGRPELLQCLQRWCAPSKGLAAFHPGPGIQLS
jgi:two-component system sensor histidine kinase/response regulator